MTTRRGNSHHVDAKRIVISGWAAAVIVGSAISTTVVGVGTYYQITWKLDAVARKVDTLTTDVVTKADLENWCLRAAMLNKGWQCPFGETAQADPRTRGFGALPAGR